MVFAWFAQVLTDRFYTGNDNPPQCDLSTYCGGTWSGIADKLDYITSMGFDAIWISPIVVNTPNGYHGYWASDITNVNPHFGSESDLLNLVRRARSVGLVTLSSNRLVRTAAGASVPLPRCVGDGGCCWQSHGLRRHLHVCALQQPGDAASEPHHERAVW